VTKSRETARDSISKLDRDVINCERCPRLRTYCRAVAREKKKAFQDQKYWGRPIPNFGDSKAQLLIVGLAPAAHGANRTGRMFTGDRSGQWLYRALHRAGFANQSSFEDPNDGLQLINCVITAVAHCAPPENKPLPDEIDHCAEYLDRTFKIYRPKLILALGAIAWKAVITELKRENIWLGPMPKFSHGAEIPLPDGRILIGTYHPSQQNTFTKVLTESMLDSIFIRAKHLLSKPG
jgi:uracil-DNA glycosylase family 4